MYNNWVDSGYKKDLIPSIDRLNDYIGYSFDNIQLVTFGENNRKAMKQKRMGLSKMGEVCISVVQISLTGEYMGEFQSLIEAARQNNVKTGSIGYVIKKKQKTAHGFYWVEKEEYYKNPSKHLDYAKTLYQNTTLLKCDKDLNILETFESLTDASKKTGIIMTAINNNIKGRSHTCFGFKWIYQNDYDFLRKEN